MPSYITPAYWKYIGVQAFAAATPAGAVQAVNTLLGRAVYQDGSARVAGAGKAWVGTLGAGNAYVQCVAPAGGRGGVVVLGHAAAAAPPMIGSETFLANALHLQTGPDGGAVTTPNWYDANPFGPGVRSTGCVRASIALAVVGNMHVWECEDAIAFDTRTAAAAHYPSGAGWLIDPYSNQATDCDATEGTALWALFTQGSTSAMISTFTSAAANALLAHAAAAGGIHVHYVQPGGAIGSGIRNWSTLRTGSAGTRVMNSTRLCRNDTIIFEDFTSDNQIGKLRGIVLGPQAQGPGRVMSLGAAWKATSLASSELAVTDALWFNEEA